MEAVSGWRLAVGEDKECTACVTSTSEQAGHRDSRMTDAISRPDRFRLTAHRQPLPLLHANCLKKRRSFSKYMRMSVTL